MYKLYFYNGESYTVERISIEFDETGPVDIAIKAQKETLDDIAIKYARGPFNCDYFDTCALFARLSPFAILPEGVYDGWGN